MSKHRQIHEIVRSDKPVTSPLVACQCSRVQLFLQKAWQLLGCLKPILLSGILILCWRVWAVQLFTGVGECSGGVGVRVILPCGDHLQEPSIASPTPDCWGGGKKGHSLPKAHSLWAWLLLLAEQSPAPRPAWPPPCVYREHFLLSPAPNQTWHHLRPLLNSGNVVGVLLSLSSLCWLVFFFLKE